MFWATKDRRQRADLSVEGTSVRRLPRGELGTPGRYWIDTHVPSRIAELAGGRDVRVLDLGCHDGAYLDALRTAGVTGEYLGIDIAPSPRWEETPKTGRLRAEWRVWDAHRVGELPAGGFDIILSVATFEHFERDGEVLAGVTTQLRPGGHFVLVVPSPYSFAVYGNHGFRRYHDVETCRRLVAGGLEVVTVTPVGGVPSFAWSTLWFQGAQAVRVAGKAALGVAAGFSRARAKRLFGPFDATLNSTQFWHQRTWLGRAAHRGLVRASARLDAWLPGLPVLYEIVARKPT